MARPRKQGLDYFPLDVDFFQDRKIKKLKAEYGADGITIYIYILCEIYRNGYYIVADEDFIDSMADELRMSVNKINLVLRFLLKRSLFNDKLFQSDTVLTSESVQRRYQFITKERINDHNVETKDFWLLKKSDTETLRQVYPFLENPQEKVTKESKEKESKVNKSTLERKKKKVLTPEEKEELIRMYGTEIVEDYTERTTQYNCCNLSTIRRWIEEDKEKENNRRNRKNSFTNYSQRKYTKEEMEDLEAKLLRMR